MGSTLSDRLFNVTRETANEPADDSAEREMQQLLRNHSVPFERIGWDYYDDSLEIHGVPPEYRLSEEARKTIAAENFAKVYVNHIDGWETHYGVTDVSAEGWRVSYPHKRGEGSSPIWVEKRIDSWPKEWFDTGYVVIKPPAETTGS